MIWEVCGWFEVGRKRQLVALFCGWFLDWSGWGGHRPNIFRISFWGERDVRSFMAHHFKTSNPRSCQWRIPTNVSISTVRVLFDQPEHRHTTLHNWLTKALKEGIIQLGSKYIDDSQAWTSLGSTVGAVVVILFSYFSSYKYNMHMELNIYNLKTYIKTQV